jgi:transposase
MAQYIINSKHASVIALDTHARTTTARGINLATGETKTRRFNDCPTPAEIAAWIQDSFPLPHYAAYESGCTGFYLCRELNALGIDCDVIAVSTIARSTDDKQRKSDRKDAKRLLHELITPGSSLSRVWLPDPGLEGTRDLLRCYRDASNALRRIKQQTTALLLRHGHVFNEKTPTGKRRTAWGKAFTEWLDRISLGSPEADRTLSFYRSAAAEGAGRLKLLAAEIEGIAKTPEYKPYVDALCCIKGIDVYSAMVYVAEIGDFSRFRNGKSVSRWVGTTPKSHASGEKQQANGHITKAGNANVRLALIEGCSNLWQRKYAPAGLKDGQEVPAHIIAECNKCNRRLIDRHAHLTGAMKKTANVAKVAVANEMIRWVWAIGCMVQEDLRARAAG